MMERRKPEIIFLGSILSREDLHHAAMNQNFAGNQSMFDKLDASILNRNDSNTINRNLKKPKYNFFENQTKKSSKTTFPINSSSVKEQTSPTDELGIELKIDSYKPLKFDFDDYR